MQTGLASGNNVTVTLATPLQPPAPPSPPLASITISVTAHLDVERRNLYLALGVTIGKRTYRQREEIQRQVGWHR